jgi:hypothetical protein
MVKQDEVRKRLRLNEQKQLMVTQAGLDIPLVPGQDETPLKALAKELASKVPAKWRNAKVRRGSGLRDGDSGNTETGDGNVYDRIREEHKPAKGSEVVPHPLDVAASRLGQRVG